MGISRPWETRLRRVSKRVSLRRSRKTAPRRRPASKPRQLRITEAHSSPLDLRRRFGNALTQHCPIAVDARAAGRLSAAQMQVLIAAALSAKGAGVSFRIVNASEPFLASIEDLGLAAWLREHREDLAKSD